MQELKKNTIVTTNVNSVRDVTIFIESNFIILSGNWYWDLNSEAVFCSDVMFAQPPDFLGTKGIIHPDDLEMVKEKLLYVSGRIGHFEFRIITTYGEVKALAGENINIEKEKELPENFQTETTQKIRNEIELQKEFENLQLVNKIYEKTEKFNNAGVWFYNQFTNETWYSDQVFRIFDLPPQSLNAHLNTFTSFIHPDDKNTVTEYIDKAYKLQLPLNIEYRIKTASREKFVLYTSRWFFSEKGEIVFSGTIQDITLQIETEQKTEQSQNAIEFFKQQLFFDENHANIGHWQMNLLTRKISYSDNHYRIYGLKPQSIAAGINTFINYIHPDDREAMILASKKMVQEHKIPELEYRIIRSDGKIRYISQKCKLVSYGNELVMAAMIQDITVQRMLEKKIEELTDNARIKTFVHDQAEGIASIGSWIWNINKNKIVWSDSFYKLLGFKPLSVEMTQKRLLLFIHPDDQKKFTDELSIVLQEKKDTEFEFRLIQRGQIRFMRACFRKLENETEDFFIGTIQDITKENLLEQKLFSKVQLSEALSENVLDKVIITDIDNNILLWNKQCEEFYKIKKDHAVGKNFFDVFPAFLSEEKLQLFNKVLKGESIRLEGIKSTLSPGYSDLHMLPLWSAEDIEVAGIIHIMHDVTREIELQQSLGDRLSFIENLVESSVDRIIALDPNMNYLVWNKKCEEYYGLKKEQVIGKNVLEIFPDTQNTPTYEEFKKVLRGELVYIAPQINMGKENYNEIYLIPVKNEKNEIAAVLWIFHDLSKEFELHTQQLKTYEIIDALSEGYVEFDNNYRFTYLNSVAEIFIKKNKKDLIGKTISEVFTSNTHSLILEALTKAIEEKEPTRGEFISQITGTWVFVSIAPIMDGASLVFYDIQALKEAELIIKERENLLQQISNDPHTVIENRDARE